MAEYYKTLIETGICVIPVTKDTAKIHGIHSKYIKMIETLPEFNTSEGLKVLGGFGALGTASSFHHPFIRNLRGYIYRKISPIFKEDSRKLEYIIDRAMFRPSGQSPASETWHRDEAPNALEGDTIYGGWYNLDTEEDQIFSCIPGSHTEVQGHGGFSKIPKGMKKELDAKSKKIKIPPGHIIIFNENTIHEVNPHKKDYTMTRMFAGWRLTDSDTPLTPNLINIIEDQDIVPIKSGQIPTMYSKSHIMFHHKLLEDMAISLLEECKYGHTFKSGKRKGQTKIFPKMHSPSLKELGILYPEYKENEIKILYPHK